ncbi:MAG TPA: hypothetical protein VFR24_09885 [Candidatus Angelobacter sp.]|nr:hypothetical protein [Candidatus Angelobacter sp.]
MRTKVIRMLVLGMLLLGATMIYADGSPIPWCPGGCLPNPNMAAR